MRPDMTVLTDPDGFFRSRLDSPSLRWSLAVVATVAVFRVASSVVASNGLSELLAEQGIESTQAGTGPLGLALAALIPFLTWAVFAGLFYGISGLLDGEGDFPTLLAFVGYGFVPQVFGSALGVLVQFYRWEIRGVSATFPSGITGTSPAEMSGEQAVAYAQALQEAQSGPLVTLTTVLGIVFTVWAAFIWVFATKRARDVSVRRAAVAVGIPVGIVLLVQIALFAIGTLLF